MEPFGRFAQHDAVLELRLLCADTADQIAEIELAVPVGHDASDSARDLHELANFEIAMRRQRHHRNGADLLQGQIEIYELQSVRELHHQTVERPDSEVEQIERESGGAFVELAV